MRVALFIDGKNFYAGWKDRTSGRDIDFRKLSQWVVRAAGGDHLMSATYYTGVDTSFPTTPTQDKIENFLSMLELQPGFFVRRFAQKLRTHTCPSCQASNTVSHEKEVDTTIVADMLRLGATGAFDIAVLLSGDADLVPAVEGVRALGKQVFVATWGSSGLSARIRRAAFDHIDLCAGLAEFGRLAFGFTPTAAAGAPTFAHVAASPTSRGYEGSGAPVAPLSNDPAVYEAFAIDEIRKAQAAMKDGYVGVHFFVTRWRSVTLPEIPDLRRRTLDRLVEDGRIEIYLADDGTQAVRLNVGTAVESGAPIPMATLASASAALAVPLSNDPAVYDEACIAEIRRAQAAMPGGYIGAHFFVTRWKSSTLPEIVDFRRRTLDRVVAQGKAEVYLTEDGLQAVRLTQKVDSHA